MSILCLAAFVNLIDAKMRHLCGFSRAPEFITENCPALVGSPQNRLRASTF
jgi:hypothetical protein